MRCFCCLFKSSLIEVLSTSSKLHLFETYILISFDVSVFLWDHLHSQAHEHIPHPQKSLCCCIVSPSHPFLPTSLPSVSRKHWSAFWHFQFVGVFKSFIYIKSYNFSSFFCLTSFIIIHLRFICVECISSSLVLFVSWMLNQPCVTR